MDGDIETHRDGEHKAEKKERGRVPFFCGGPREKWCRCASDGPKAPGRVGKGSAALHGSVCHCALSAALSGRLYVHKITRVHISMRVRVSPALGTKSDRKVLKKKMQEYFLLICMCDSVSAGLGCGRVGGSERGACIVCQKGS